MSAVEQTSTIRPPVGDTSSRGGGWRGLLWLTLRQHRWLVLGTAAAVAALTGWLLLSLREVDRLVAQCAGGVCADSSPQAGTLLAHSPGVGATINLQLPFVAFLPLLFGLLWGAPLVAREYEQRTAALAWSQDVSPVRWLLAKLLFLGVVVAVLTAAPTLVATHIAGTIHTAAGPSMFEDSYFQLTAGLPVALAVAWFTLGVALGAATRRTTVAIGVAAALFVARFVALHQLRPHYLHPVTGVRSLASFREPLGLGPNPLVIRGDGISPDAIFVDAAGGHHSGSTVLGSWCTPGAPPVGASRVHVVAGSPDDVFTCLRSHHLTGLVLQYQPGSRIGVFHLIEGGSSVVLAVVGVLVSWLVVRRSRIV